MKKLTEEYLEKQIVSKEFIRPESQPTLTLCVLVTKNGCAVIGQSACVDPEEFREETGQNVSYKHAFGQLWQLEGYLLRQKRLENGKN